jgi:hypothetical protein
MPDITTPVTPTTILEAINALLQGIRVQRVFSLDAAYGNEDATTAKKEIDRASIELQQMGWFFNEENGAILDPTPGGEIELAANVLKVRSARFMDSGRRLTQRGNRLYDPVKRSFVIGGTATVDLTVALEFAELSQAARQYITALAARRFCIPRLPKGATFRYTEEMVTAALVALQQEDTEQRDAALPETSPHFADMARR